MVTPEPHQVPLLALAAGVGFWRACGVSIRMTPATTAAVAIAERIVNGSLRITAPRMTATTGLTNA